MLTREEAERLAQAIHALRADWPTASLLTFLGKRKERPLLDLTIELAWVAQLPDTKSPARIDEDGPWKGATRTVVGAFAVQQHIDFGTACVVCLQPEFDHPLPFDEHPWTPPAEQPPAPAPSELRELLKTRPTEEATP